MLQPIRPQLDLFEHSADTMLRNDVLDALLRRDAAAAGQALQALRLLAELLGLEREGRHAELMAARKRLRDLQPALYAAYMRSR